VLTDRTAGSADEHRASSALLPTVATGTLRVPYPIYVRSAHGARVVDVDGNEYIDLTMGFGPHILGHAAPVVVEAVREAARRGLQFALHSPYQRPLAELIAAAAPGNERVLFCNSGTEATMHAIRVARGFTGRERIAIFEGGYHGAHDYAMVVAEGEGRGAGVTRAAVSTVSVLPFWSDAAFDAIRSQAGELAAVVVEAVQGANPQTGQGEWLLGLREVCSDAGVLLLVDEVLTGFRLGYGGAQERFALRGDLVTYGKIIGGGLPVGAVAGRAELMERFSNKVPEADQVFSTGTFSGNPLSMAAGAAVLEQLRAQPDIYEQLARQSHRLADELNGFGVEREIPVRVDLADSIMFLRLSTRREPPRTAREAALDVAPAAAYDALQLRLLERGVILPGVHQFHLSAAHTDDDVDEVIEACTESLLEVEAEGLF
jgi:glutamate-1-semialdehyde 2,1-aminomutase